MSVQGLTLELSNMMALPETEVIRLPACARW